MKIVLALLALITLAAQPAMAQVYSDLTYGNIAKTLFRFGAANLQDDKVIDDYLKLNHCDLFRNNFRDDFALRRLREATRKSILKQAAGYPDAYYFKSQMQLDKYDFNAKTFMLAAKSQLRNINSFYLAGLGENDVCIIGQKVEVLPAHIGAVLDQPVTLEGLPITEEHAKGLIERLNAAQNFDRTIYARFSLMIVFAPPVATAINVQRYNMDAQLLNIEFFEDANYTKPIWVFTRG